MTENRDFKGIWIPKEIWLNTQLSALDKIIFAEINSLDGEDHCVAGNEYLSTFCQCSERKVSDSVKKLIDLKLIEIVSFDGRHRKIRVVKNTSQSSKKDEADSQNLRPINITNKKTNNNTIINNSTDFEFGKTKQTKPKQNLYSKCISILNDFTEDFQLRLLLTQYLNLRLEMKDKPMYVNQWKGLLNKLAKLSQDTATQIEIVQYSIDRGYASFFELPNKSNFSNNKNKVFGQDENISCKQSTTTNEERKQLLRQQGLQEEF